jgi:hypothetical protein
MSVQGSPGLVRHEDFDLTRGQILDVVVASARLALFALHRPSRLQGDIPEVNGRNEKTKQRNKQREHGVGVRAATGKN